MSTDIFDQQIDAASLAFARSCFRPRYRVAWLTGGVQSGKSIAARRLADRHNWTYLDYSLTPGYFDQRVADIQTYQPDDFIRDIRQWCQAVSEPVLIIDEIDALLAFWTETQRRIWAANMAWSAGLPCGLILVTHFFEITQLRSYLPDNDIQYCFDLSGELL